MSKRTLASAAVALVAMTAVGGSTTLQADPASRATYVVMGDSYSAGAQIAPLQRTANPLCSRSTANYAQVVVKRTRVAEVTDVTCSGAETKHLRQSQYPNVAPQLEVLSPSTELVTLTLGANDGRVFGTSLTACVARSAADPTGNPCEQHYGEAFVRQIRKQTTPNLVRALTEIRRAAPKAQVVVLGYLRMLPAVGSPECTRATRIAQGDVAYVNRITAALNAAVRRAASQTGTLYLDTWQPSLGRDACQSPDRRWVEPVMPANAAAYHPNERGEEAMADLLIERLDLL